MMFTAMAPRTVLLIGALSLTAGWWLGTSVPSSQNQAGGATTVPSGPRPLGSPSTAAPLTRQLRERLATPPPRTPSVGRNPFVFGSRRPAEATRDRGEPSVEPPPSPPVPVEPPAPLFKLSGIASSLVDGTIVWTAIINDNGSLAFVKAGEPLSNGHRVLRVEENGVVIVDAAGITQTLRLP